MSSIQMDCQVGPHYEVGAGVHETKVCKDNLPNCICLYYLDF